MARTGTALEAGLAGRAGAARADDALGFAAMMVAEAEERFRLTLEHAPIGMAIIELDGQIRDVNRELSRILGRTPDELRAVRYEDFAHPDDDAPPIYRELAPGAQEFHRAEKRYVRPDGSVVWAELTGMIVRRPDGAPLHIVALLRDLTERRTWERSLREQDLRLRALADGSTDFFVYRVSLEPELSYDYLSEAVEAVSGYTVAELEANPMLIFERVHPEDLPLMRARMTEQRMGGTDVTYRFRHRDGHQIWIKARSAPVVVDGRIVAMDGIATDVTAQMQARQQKAWFSRLVANSSHVILAIDGHGVIQQASPSVETVLGWTTEETIGDSLWAGMHHEDIAVNKDHFVNGRVGQVTRVRMRHRSGAWRWMEAQAASMDEDAEVRGIVVTLRDITDQAAAEAALARQAVTDGLTRLPNRTLLRDRISRAIARREQNGTTVGVLTVNLDRFHTVNMDLGHEAGDRVLIEAGARLTALVPPNQTVGRFAADELVVCAEGPDVDHVFDVAERVRLALARPFVIGEDEIVLSGSVGVAVVEDAGDTVDDALARSGLALREAKANGGDVVHVFGVELRERARRRREIERGLRTALEKQEFALHYQPIVDVRDGRPVSVEALLRWFHPERGPIGPDDFVPVAEDIGLIADIGDWVIDEACGQLARWRQQPGLDDLTVSINVAAQQLDDEAFATRLQRTIDAHELHPADIVLEVTESAAVSGDHLARLEDAAELGVGIAIDDFGTHYSSLSHITRLPVDYIKIDRSFTSGVTGDRGKRAIIMAVAQLARGLRLATVAEGVETQEQADDIALLGIDRAQGYLYSRPVPATEIEELSRSM